jgi:hypothetical protein
VSAFMRATIGLGLVSGADFHDAQLWAGTMCLALLAQILASRSTFLRSKSSWLMTPS